MRTQTNIRAGELKVYGSDNCSWTKKQLAYLNKKGIPYQYVNCMSEQCPDFVSAFPTLAQRGKIIVGYQEL
jgi:glutaredoxin-related protein